MFRPLAIFVILGAAACGGAPATPDVQPREPLVADEDPEASAETETSNAESEPLTDLGGRTWVSEPTAAEGGSEVIALLQVAPVDEEHRKGPLANAIAELEIRLFHPVANSSLCRISSMSSCTKCAMSSLELPEELDCTLAAGHEMEVRRIVSLVPTDTGVLVEVDGRTGYKVPVPTSYNLRPTNGIRIAYGLLSEKTTGNQSSETAALKALIGPMRDEAERRGASATELEELLTARGLDPMTVSIELGLKLRDKVREINMQSLRHPPARPEFLDAMLDHQFPETLEQ